MKRERMFRLTSTLFLLFLAWAGMVAQEVTGHIVTDQFGYLPGSSKIAVIRDPQVGFDAGDSFTPGTWYALVDAATGEKVFRGRQAVWGGGATDASSGDRAWQFDFSSVERPGTYYILDEERFVRSHPFVISHNVYNEVLRQAMRTFFYQRSGFRKEADFAGGAWADEASHLGNLQDLNCRSFFDRNNPSTERDVSGGWYDAGDLNKYTSWTANYVVELMKAYLEKPDAWGDDYRIPESGNGIPDILDEARWGMDHLLRLQLPGGSVLSIVGASHASPPSAATGPSFFGPPNTSATLNASAAFAIGSRVYRALGMEAYADTLLSRATKAWDWATIHPDSLFDNNDPAYGSEGLGAGRQEVGDYGRAMARLEAACYLFGETGEATYRDYFDLHYQECHLIQWNWAYPFESLNQEVLLYYASLPGGTGSVQDHIRSVYRNTVVNGADNMAAYTGNKDPYQAYIKDYTWGSNSVKSAQGNMNQNLITYGMAGGIETVAGDAAGAYLHYLHGLNPMGMVYLSNMYDYGAEKGVNEFYHTWFSNGSPLWDRVGTSLFGPAPGFLTGGPNPGYDWDGCCPSGCGSTGNNQACLSESISPPKGQPDQKSYKDFNTSWPLNSWSVTENSCGYQVNYIRLLSKFVTAGMDCNGELDGGAFMDSCGVCAGGNTGIIPSLSKKDCLAEPVEPAGDTMYIEGRHLFSAAGEKVVLRGVNEMFVWSDDPDGSRLLPEIAQTGANAVRLVWTEEAGNKGTLLQLIENCINLHMIAIPECHSATGDWANLDVCINFWNDPLLLEGIQRNRKWTLLNIGNEVGDGSVTPATFSEGYRRAIDSLRGWGYTVPIVIDASNWGQDVDIIFQTWQEIQAHDPLHNILFSVHSYWGDAGNYDRIASESINRGLPVIIGEGPSPTRYPTCEVLDYARGLEVAGRNEIGWLSWSWGGLPNGHCVPNFDHALGGVFGEWRTIYASDMMVDHPFSLMRTARRPASFYPGDTVVAAGIYLSPEVGELNVGDTVVFEVLVTPLNATDRSYAISVTGDGEAVDFDPASGQLIAKGAGTVQLTALHGSQGSVAFSRTVQVREIPVESIVVVPSEADLQVGDTLYFRVEVAPGNATTRDYTLEVTQPGGVIELDSAASRVVATGAGLALVTATWVNGDVSGTMELRVSDINAFNAKQLIPNFTLYPNPNEGTLHVECDQQIPVAITILDLGGRVILEARYTGHTVLTTGSLSPGTYLVVHTGRDLVMREKLIML